MKLRKIRQDRHLSLEEVQKKTKIHTSVLEALEEDRLDNFSPVYVKGFLKIYCGYLGIDNQPFIQEYLSKVTPSQEVQLKEKSLFSPKVSLKLPNLFLDKKNLLVFLAVLLVLIIGLFLFSIKGHKRVIVSPKKEPVSTDITSSSKPKIKKNSSLISAVSSPIETPKTSKEFPYSLRLVLRAKEDSLVKVSVDDKLIFQSVLRKGKSESWQAKNRIEFFLGNAGAVEVEVNEKNLGLLGRKKQTIKNITITKEGLTVAR